MNEKCELVNLNVLFAFNLTINAQLDIMLCARQKYILT